jgi:hypothetical protein
LLRACSAATRSFRRKRNELLRVGTIRSPLRRVGSFIGRSELL